MSDLVQLARSRIGAAGITHWDGCESVHVECLIQRMADEIERLRAERDALRSLLAELTALVRGECPSLLDEDRGGTARLSFAIDKAVEAGRQR